MKVLIHALGATMGGGMRHLTNFLPELGRQDSKNEYTVLVRNSFPSIEIQKNIQLECVPDAQASGWLSRLIADVFLLPRRLQREEFDYVVSLTNFGVIWSSVPHIFFQRNSLYYCPYYLSRVSGKQKIETLLRRRWAIESMKHAALIVTPSHAMTEMIRETCPQSTNWQFYSLYHGFSRSSLQAALDTKYAKLLSTKCRKLLYPTHPAPHKGFEILFEILNILKRKSPDFILYTTISPDEWHGVRHYEKRIRDLGLKNHVVFLGQVPQQQMGALYQQCDLMVYPSLCESFGFSMIEAMGYGLPIVAAGTSVNREICAEGALYYSPEDPEDGATTIMNALDPTISGQIVAGGQKQFASFDWGWERYTRDFIKMLERIA